MREKASGLHTGIKRAVSLPHLSQKPGTGTRAWPSEAIDCCAGMNGYDASEAGAFNIFANLLNTCHPITLRNCKEAICYVRKERVGPFCY